MASEAESIGFLTVRYCHSGSELFPGKRCLADMDCVASDAFVLFYGPVYTFTKTQFSLYDNVTFKAVFI